jgi:hypothetical protein
MSFAAWLALREPADAAARATDLVERLPPTGRHVIHDLGAGTGAMGRWLAPRLSGPQHWVLHDRDEDLLRAAGIPGVTLETRRSDAARPDLTGATLITASALLDLLTEDEIRGLVAACAGAGCPALLTLSVTGQVELTPADPLDGRVAAAFNAHQHRDGRLGPDAAARAAQLFREAGMEIVTRPSPWRLGPGQAELAAAWFSGWVDAACEQEPELAAYPRRRLSAVAVDHVDVLAQPPLKRADSA